MFYEDDLREELKDIIKNKFSIEINRNCYIILRYMFINNISKVSDINNIEFAEYVLKELNLCNKIYFKDYLIDINSFDNSLFNIINNWIFDLGKDNSIFFIENFYRKTNHNSFKKYTRLKDTLYYKEKCLLECLETLNKEFNIKLKNYVSNKFIYPEDFKCPEKFYEDILKEKIDILKKADNTIIFTEKEIENFFKNNLNKIEDGLEFIKCQYPIKDAFIDILAKDKNGKFVIIEVKIKNDERLIWQTIYYPKQFKLEKNIDDVRMITLSPCYSDWILSALEEIKNIEIFKYQLLFNESEIFDLFIEKI